MDFNLIGLLRYKWQNAIYFYERNGHSNVAGLHTCHLMMQSLANSYRMHNITYSSFVTDSAAAINMTENLRREVGLDHSSKYNKKHYTFIYKWSIISVHCLYSIQFQAISFRSNCIININISSLFPHYMHLCSAVNYLTSLEHIRCLPIFIINCVCKDKHDTGIAMLPLLTGQASHYTDSDLFQKRI